MPADSVREGDEGPIYRSPRCACCRQRVLLVGARNRSGRGGGKSFASQGHLLWSCSCPQQLVVGHCFFCGKCADHCPCAHTIFVEA
jgi:hypothetical protein